MRTKKIITAEEAALLVKDGDTISTSGFVASGCPEALTKALEKRFLETGSPKDLTYFFPGSQGNRDGSGADHFAHKGLLKRMIAGHYNTAPAIGKMILNNEIEAYNLPQGTLSQLCRDIAAHKLGTITHVGLNTFVDPRIEGGKMNARTTENAVELVNILGQERLLYKAFPINVAFLRGSYADEAGNVTLHKEIGPGETTAIAQAVKNSGGIVIVQVEKVVKAGLLDPRLVRLPKIYVDALVITKDPEDHLQSFGCDYDPSLCGELQVPAGAIPIPPLSPKKVIGRRAAMELTMDTVVNLGIGIPEYVSAVANEEGILDWMTLTVEAGPVGGVPAAVPVSGLLLMQKPSSPTTSSLTSTTAVVQTWPSWVWLRQTKTVTSTSADLAPELPDVVDSSTSLRTPREYSTAAPLPPVASRPTSKTANSTSFRKGPRRNSSIPWSRLPSAAPMPHL
jgi:propionate CoA-transferase